MTGVEGQTLDFKCEYSHNLQSNAKYLCNSDSNKPLIRTTKQNDWETNGRFSLYDNTTAAFILIRITNLAPEDSGKYICGVDISLYPDEMSSVQVNVSQGTVSLVMSQGDIISPFFFCLRGHHKIWIWLVISLQDTI